MSLLPISTFRNCRRVRLDYRRGSSSPMRSAASPISVRLASWSGARRNDSGTPRRDHGAGLALDRLRHDRHLYERCDSRTVDVIVPLMSQSLRRDRTRTPRFAPFVAVLAVLLTGCGSTAGNANLGSDPGGGFYCPHNAFEGCI